MRAKVEMMLAHGCTSSKSTSSLLDNDDDDATTEIEVEQVVGEHCLYHCWQVSLMQFNIEF